MKNNWEKKEKRDYFYEERKSKKRSKDYSRNGKNKFRYEEA